MSTNKHFNKICCVVVALTLILTVMLMNAESFGIQSVAKVKGYETRLFDDTKVHTIDIVMDDWDSFIASCTNEEYELCSVVIDGEAYNNVAIRAKGNTSLTQVQSYGNDRYSFKIEFDHYDSTKTYYGLDKLCLNNIIQDNTYMKDYLSYKMMSYFGVSSPLCSYVSITVNGENWGLYLAVEGIEEAFLERNYGSDYGELYNPDSQSMGGGRGNGERFDMDEWMNDEDQTSDTQDESNTVDSEQPQQPQNGDEGTFNQMPDMQNRDEIPLEMLKNIISPADDDTLQSIADALEYASSDELVSAAQTAESADDILNGKDFSVLRDLVDFKGSMSGDRAQNDAQNAESGQDMGGGFKGSGMGTMGSDDVLLVYTDDSYDSYSNIFDNAKTDITDEDKDRLIESLKLLSENSSLEDIVNIDEVIRYFVVHNFVCNFDSYTGSMIHNYYLYEDDGQLSMIPWDYNLAFGGFQSASSATSLVNYPIDTPVSSGTIDERPMLAWIFSNEEYTQLYHQYFEEFISEYFDSGYFSNMIDSVKSMISEYVEANSTKFCTYDEFITGIDTLKEFCIKRAQSVTGQLDGSIPSTSEEQTNAKDSLIDASDIVISDMGSMNNGGGMGQPNGMQGMPNMQGAPDMQGMPDMNGETTDNSQIQLQMASQDGQAQNGMQPPQGRNT